MEFIDDKASRGLGFIGVPLFPLPVLSFNRIPHVNKACVIDVIVTLLAVSLNSQRKYLTELQIREVHKLQVVNFM
jgi:hypothetical protein